MFKILYENPKEDLITRLLKIRGINDNPEDFINPSFKVYRKNPFDLNDMDLAVQRIKKAIKDNQRIVIFGDYDVDGLTSSYTLYMFLRKFLNYPNVTIRLPSRIKDGYGIKTHHIDEIKNLGGNLIITVDNGITSIKEAAYAQELWIDMIITDHHKNLEEIPKAIAVINPNISPQYPFKGLAGVWVVFKLISALSQDLLSPDQKRKVIDFFLPVVATWTIADMVPLVDENRLFAKKGLNLLNQGKGPQSLRNFIKHLNIKTIDAFHISFMIAPRLNASWRMDSPYDALKTLLYSSGEKRNGHFSLLEELNTQRKTLQADLLKEAENLIDKSQPILIAAHPDFHEGIIGLIAGKLTEKYNKPSIIIAVNQDKQIGVASLRSPSYFSTIDMLHALSNYLIRYWGHAQAGWLTISLEKLEEFKQKVYEYWHQHISPDQLEKVIEVDTPLYPGETSQLINIPSLAPFGESNPQPILLFKDILIKETSNVGKNGASHLKIIGEFDGKLLSILFWKKGEFEDQIQKGALYNLVWKIKENSFNGWIYIEGVQIRD